MAFIAKDSGGGGDFKKVPPGVYIGRCYSLVDLGTQTSTFEGEEKIAHKIRIAWELFGEDDNGVPLTVLVDGHEMPLVVSKNYTLSLHEKAGLRKELAAWRGKDFTEDEAKGFDVSKLMGAYCMINITHRESAGKSYTNVSSVTPLPGALKNAKPAPVHGNVTFDLDAPDMKVFQGFYAHLQETIKKSPEWQARMGGDLPSRQATQQEGEFHPSDDDEIPF